MPELKWMPMIAEVTREQRLEFALRELTDAVLSYSADHKIDAIIASKEFTEAVNLINGEDYEINSVR